MDDKAKAEAAAAALEAARVTAEYNKKQREGFFKAALVALAIVGAISAYVYFTDGKKAAAATPVV